MEITRGSLDEITRPASNTNNRQRPGSRVSLNSAGSSSSAYRFNTLNTETSLEILPPEDISQEAHDIEVVEFYSGSDDEDDDLAGIQNGSCNDHRLMLRLQEDDSEHDTASVETDDPNSTLGNEDKGSEGGQDNNNAGTEDPDNGLDPKIATAMRKMRQLDRILAKRVKREKEVKRQRLDLHRQLQRELDGVKPEGRDELKEVSDNTSKFLALIPPSSHNEGVDVEDDLASVSPVFATQPLDADANNERGGQRDDGYKSNRHGGDGESTDRSGPQSGRDDQTGSGKKSNKKNKRSKGKRTHDDKDGDKADFIRRNIELATDAGNVIAMTDDEKKRLEELLQEVEMLHDEDEEEATNMPFNQLQLAPGNGYLPDANEQRTLQDIDAKLMALMPSKDFMSICSTPIQGSSMISGFSDMSSEMFNLGEKVLIDTKQARAQQDRLLSIEEELARMQNTVEQEIKSPRISNERLAEILRQCDDLSSRATSEASSYIRSSTSTSPRDDTQVEASADNAIVEVPKLPDDVLRHLLDEAKEAGITSARTSGGISSNRSLSTVNEGEEEEDLESEPYTDRSSQAGALVSYDMIQELLKNPRATSVTSSQGEYPSSAAADNISPRLTNGTNMVSPRDDAYGNNVTPRPRSVNAEVSTTPRSLHGRSKTPVSQSPRNSTSSSLKSSYNTEHDVSEYERYAQDQRSSANVNHVARSSAMSTYSLEQIQIAESNEYTNSGGLQARFARVSLEDDSHEEFPVDPRLQLKTRGSSRIAFAETNSNSQFKQNDISNMTYLGARQSGDMSKPYRIPTPPQMSQSPGPQKSKPPSSSRSKKSRSRASSKRKSPSQSGPSPDQDLRVESVSASASYTAMTDRTDSQASTNTLVSSSDFEYEDDEEVQQQMLKAPGNTKEEEMVRRMTSPGARQKHSANNSTYHPQPTLPRLQVMRESLNKPVLPVDKQQIHGIENYAESDDESDKPFSPVFF